MRQIALDTETTGLNPDDGHRIIEIGCIELVNRRLTGKTFHVFCDPEREVEQAALQVHGITNDFLRDKPKFAAIENDLMQFIDGAELIIHNAPFDVGFLEHEFKLAGNIKRKLRHYCAIVDTLPLARKLHPGQRNSLDALCKRYSVDNTHRDLHGALLDAELLASVYLAMTGGQGTLFVDASAPRATTVNKPQATVQAVANSGSVKVVATSTEELVAHDEYLKLLDKASEGNCLWRKIESEN